MPKPTEKPKGKRQKKKPTLKKKYPPKKTPKPKVFQFTGLDGKKYSLTEQQKKFAECFCDFDMNGVDAIIEAGYNVENSRGDVNLRLAANMASENLRKPNIYAYINSILDRYGFNDEHVDKQTLAVINQWGDMSAKVRAIDIYNKKRGHYAVDKSEVNKNQKLEEYLDRASKLLPD